MPAPKGTKSERCRMQRAIFSDDPDYGKKWVDEFGDQCTGIPMKATRRAAKKTKKK